MHLKHTHLSVLELKMKNSCSSPTPRVPTSPQMHLAVRWDLFFFSQKLFCHTLCLYLSFYPNCMWIIPWIDFLHTGERNAFVPLLNILDLCEFSNIFVFVCVCVCKAASEAAWSLESWQPPLALMRVSYLPGSPALPPRSFLSDGSLTPLTRLTPPISFGSARSLFRLDSWLAAALQRVITVWFDRRQGVVSNQTEKRS